MVRKRKVAPEPVVNNLVQLQARVSPKLLARIQRCADAEEISVSAYVRRTLKNHVPGG